MKKKFIYLLCLIGILSLGGCIKHTDETVPPTVKFMVISDIHYFDPSLFAVPINASFQGYLAADRKLIVESSAILNNVLASVQAEKPDFLLITGDLTKDGEKFDHQKLTTLFQALIDKGIKVLVIPGNHDINNSASNNYLQATPAKIDNVSPADFASIYANCGYGLNTFVERDVNSLSYVSEPIKGVWVLGIDACQYNPTGITAGAISANTLTWVKSIVAKAKQQNKILLSMMHHGLVEHFAGQSTLFPEYVISDWQNVSTQLADAGMNVIFTGHFHAQDVTKKTSANGFVFDVETGSTVTSPCPYRIATLNTVTKTLQITSKKIDGVTYSTIPAGTTFQQYAKDYLTTGMKSISYYMLNTPPYSIPGTTISALQLDRIMANAFVAHYAGDETPSAADNTDIQTVKTMIPTLGGAIQSVWTDLNPADNNVTINLTTGTFTNN
ncbi:MAG: metallophosphoesterase [Bacteroidetes bacterium]|nr:metallophosphoesterase [Bacteroidota bacterium]